MKTRAPLRISFAGGGSDIEPYCSEGWGCVLAAGIQLYAQAFYPSELVVPSEMEQTIIDYFRLEGIVKITNGAPQMSGLGGSASCFVAGIKAVKPEMERDEIAKLAFHLERNIMGIAGGIQDQYMAAYGGLNYIEFEDTTRILPIKIPLGLEELLLLVYMGKREDGGADIIADQMARDNKSNFRKQKFIAYEMVISLKKQNYREFGVLLDHAWRSKLKFSPLIASEDIKGFYLDCLDNGAIGGKLTGAGGGGYMLLMEDPDKRILREYLNKKCVKFLDVKFDLEGVKCL